MADTDSVRLPSTLAGLPFTVADQHARPDLIGRSTAAGVEWMSGRELADRVRALGVGLASLGLARGDRALLLAESRPEWLVADFAVLACGSVNTPVYPTLGADQVGFILRDCEARLAICSTAAQLDKLLAVAHTAAALTAVVVMDPPDVLPVHDHVTVYTFVDLLARGRQMARDDPAAARRFEERLSAVSPADLATLIYTSGTTGTPKGVMLTHDNLMANLRDICQVLSLSEADVALSFLPLCHTFERMVACVYLAQGTAMVFAESNDTIARDLLQVRPTVMTGVPRVFEKFQARILERGAALTGPRRALFDWAMDVARMRGRLVPDGKRLTLGQRLASVVAGRLVFRKVRAGLGGRFRFIVSGSAPLVPEVGRFFFGLGLSIIEGYGLTETSPVLTVTPHTAIRFGAVGVALPSVRLKIAGDGEILAQGPNVMVGYYKRPDETADALRDGWFHTGDIGSLDADGYLRITDRKKELLVTSGGKKIAPQPIEGLFRAHALVSEAVLVGEQRHFPAVLLVPDFAALAHELHLPRPADDAAAAALLGRPDVLAKYEAIVADVNRGLARFERLKQFRLLPREFTQASGELTPTLKVKRRVVEQQYREVIDGIYAASPGRIGSM
jgi:long-chain acyl-CoA synthetase